MPPLGGNRLKRFAATLAWSVLCLALVGFPPATASDQSPGADRSFGTPEWRDPARELLPDPDALLEQIGARFGSRAAGGWIIRPSNAADRDRVAWLRVAIVGATDADRVAVHQMTGGNRHVSVVSARYSLASLESWKEALADYLFESGIQGVSVDADEMTNLIKVTTASPPAGLFAHAQSKGIPADAWQLVVATAPRPMTTHSSRAGALPYEAGFAATMKTAGGKVLPGSPCTTWFVTKSSNGNYKGATAGHCEDSSSDHMWIGSTDLGDGALNSYLNKTRTQSDAVRYSLTSSQKTNTLLYTIPNNHIPVKSRFYVTTNGGLPVNTYLCFAGVTSNAICGFVNLINFSLQDSDGVWHDHWWRMDEPSIGGDSGAPVFQITSGKAKAAGLQDATDGDNAYFHHISYVMEDLQTTLYTG